MRLIHSGLNLRAKLVLSHIAVALGAILVLSFAVTLAVQNYFYQEQLSYTRNYARNLALNLEHRYHFAGSWANVVREGSYTIEEPVALFIADAHGGQITCVQPGNIQSICNDSTLRQAIGKALQNGGQEVDGTIQIVLNAQSISSAYVCLPLGDGDQPIGALFVTQPLTHTPEAGFLTSVNLSTLIVALGVSLIALIFSLLLARSLTRPLESLTKAAEQMKRGDYTERAPVPESQDELGRLALTFNEMADTIEADVNELRRQDQVRRDLIANIAHDLATPLTAIQGFSEALADDVVSDPVERQEVAQRIGREVQRLRRLVGDMQQMSSLETGQVRMDLAPLSMHELVDETVTVIAPECEQAGIMLRNEIAEDTPQVLADSDRITQVLLNLLDNARRHTPSGGTITVTARSEGKLLWTSVNDTGSGIAAKDLPHIFERFYRADRSRTGATGGSGLGLSIVKAIITAHGGTVSAESTPGECTSISFSLPIVATPAIVQPMPVSAQG